MKKIFIPFALMAIVLLFAAVPFMPTSYGTLTEARVTNSGPSPVLPETPYEYRNPNLPSFLQDHGDQYNPVDNSITNAGARLGRVLFYDTRLSKNLEISCASCHDQSLAFTDSAKFSEGFDGELTTRQSMGLTNARMQPIQRFFWDASADVLKDQVKLAVTSEVEMGMKFSEVIDRLQETDFYPGLFADAFGNANISEERITAAIGQFVRSMIGKNSKFDLAAEAQGTTWPPFNDFTQIENDGFNVFIENRCVNCHAVPHFASFMPSNNGLNADNSEDQGLGGVTGNAWDMGLFKAPSLRNIELTAPYMHDGRFKTIEEVIEHYNSGIKDNPALSHELREWNGDNDPIKLDLTAYEKDALKAFLLTLTDPYFIKDPLYENPFEITEPKPAVATPMDSLLNRKRFGNHSFFDLSVKAFPNPFTDFLQVELENPDLLEIRLDLVDISGKVVFRTSGRESFYKIPREKLNAGNYVLRVKSDLHSWTQMVAVK
ncbi:MAG: cytochrome c peroxidase [Bacteroidota bacterium]